MKAAPPPPSKIRSANVNNPTTTPRQLPSNWVWTVNSPQLGTPQGSNRNQIKTNRNFTNFAISIWLQFHHFICANSKTKFALGTFSSFVWLNHMLMQTTWTFSFAWVHFLIFCYTRDEAIIRNDLCIGTRRFARLLNPQCCRWLKFFCLIFSGKHRALEGINVGLWCELCHVEGILFEKVWRLYYSKDREGWWGDGGGKWRERAGLRPWR